MALDIALGERNPVNGRFGFKWDSIGDVEFDDTEAHSVMSLLVEQRARYWAASSTHGSNLYKIQSLTSLTPSRAEADALEALQPLIAAKRIKDVRAEAQVRRGSNRLVLNVYWATPGGNPGQAQIAL